jgi:hypothetical protein
LAIIVLVLWFATAGAGLTLLRAGGAARRRAAGGLPAPRVPAAQPALAAQPAAAGLARIGAIPLTAEGGPPPVPHARVATPAGEHPLLEFAHPALAVTGLAFWAMFTFVHYRPMAWTAVAVALVTIAFGLAWQARNSMDRRRKAPAAWPFSGRLLALHVTAASSSFVLAIVSALVASHS